MCCRARPRANAHSRAVSGAPQGCRQCKDFETEFADAAVEAAEQGLGFVFARMDTQEYKDDARAFGVVRIPDVFIIQDQVKSRHLGAMTGPGVLSALRNATGLEPGSPASVLTDPGRALRHVFWRGTPTGAMLPIVVGLFPGNDSEVARAAYAEWVPVAQHMQGRFRVAESHAEGVLAALHAPTDRPTVRLLRDFDEREVDWAWPFSAEELKQDLDRHEIPMVTFLTHKRIRYFQRQQHVLVHVFTDPLGAEEGTKLGRYFMTRMQKVANHLLTAGVFPRGGFTIAISDGDKYEEWMREFGLTKAMTPALAVADNCNNATHSYSYGKLEGDIVAATTDFLERVAKGEVEPVPPVVEGDEAEAFAELAKGEGKDEL